MGDVKVTIGVVLPCRGCGREVETGSIARFRAGDVERTAYFGPEFEGPPCWEAVVGTSDGSGDTFWCVKCLIPTPTPKVEG